LKTLTTDGLVFLISTAIIAEFIVGIAVNGGDILPLSLLSVLGIPLTVAFGIGIWARFMRHQAIDPPEG
jgi:hypothetical protein